MRMNYADPACWYIHEQARREQLRENNQKLLHKQLFNRAFQQGMIKNEYGHIVVLDHDRAVNHFNHHPDLFLHIPFNYYYFAHDKKALERTLNEAWRYVNSPS